MRGKKHVTDMIYSEARLGALTCSVKRTEVDTSGHPAVESTMDEEGIDDFPPPAEHFSEDSKASEEVASCELAEPTVDSRSKG